MIKVIGVLGTLAPVEIAMNVAPMQLCTPQFKAQVALRGNKALAELSERFDVYANQILQWKHQTAATFESALIPRSPRLSVRICMPGLDS